MGLFYPSLAVNLTLRFDESLFPGETPVPDSSEGMANKSGKPAGKPAEKPLLLSGTKGRLSKVLGIVPRNGSFELPGYRQAGKFQMGFAFRDFPLDPRTIRAIGVEVYLGTVTSRDFARGIAGEFDQGRLASILPMTPENLLLAGTVDNITTKHTDKGSEVTLEGRGLQGIFLDGKIAPETLKGLKLDEPINKVVAQILDRAPEGARVPIVVNADEWPGKKIPAPGVKGDLTRVNAGQDGAASARPTQGDANSLSFWDIITQYCFLVGAVPYFEGYNLRIRPARSLYDQKRAGDPLNPTVFKDGKPRQVDTSKGQVTRRIPLMVYGRDLLDFTLERKLSGAGKVPTVRCVCVDTSSKERGKARLVMAEWPAVKDGADPKKVAAAKVTSVDPSGEQSKQDIITIPVPGVRSKERLLEIARDLYEEIGRGEMGGAASTKNLSSFGGDNSDPDLLKVRPGQAVEFVVDATGLNGQPPIVSELVLDASRSSQELVKILTAKLGDADLAKIIVGTARGEFGKLQSIFRVSNCRFGWDVGSGVAVDFDFQNYIESRYDVAAKTDVTVGEPEIISITTNNGVTVTPGTPTIVGGV